MRVDILNIPKAFRTLDENCQRRVGGIRSLSVGTALKSIGRAFLGDYQGIEKTFFKLKHGAPAVKVVSMDEIVTGFSHRTGNKLIFNCNNASAEVVKLIGQVAVF
jgi:hypothetical protein